MKLISVELTRVTALFLPARSAGQPYYPDIISDLIQRYGFLEFPRDLQSMRKSKVEFFHGKFENTAIENLDIFIDGIVVTSRASSDVLDRFLADVIEYFATKWGIPIIDAYSRNRMYESSLVFQSDKDVLKPLSTMSKLSGSISERLGAVGSGSFVYEPYGISLSADHSQIASLRPAAFRIERRDAVEFSFNLYFSTAPLRTEDHLAVLQEWEDSL